MRSADGTLAKERVPLVYTALAPYYDLWAILTETRPRRRALDRADIRDGETVLEVAVGTGLAFAEILRRNPSGRNEGVDLTEAMLARARTKAARSSARHWRLRQGDAYALDFADATFDVLFNAYLFDLLPTGDFEQVLAEFLRVLKPGGRLTLVNLALTTHWRYGLWERLFRWKPAWVGGCRGVELCTPVCRAGLLIAETERITHLGIESELILARRPRRRPDSPIPMT